MLIENKIENYLREESIEDKIKNIGDTVPGLKRYSGKTKDEEEKYLKYVVNKVMKPAITDVLKSNGFEPKTEPFLDDRYPIKYWLDNWQWVVLFVANTKSATLEIQFYARREKDPMRFGVNMMARTKTSRNIMSLNKEDYHIEKKQITKISNIKDSMNNMLNALIEKMPERKKTRWYLLKTGECVKASYDGPVDKVHPRHQQYFK